MRQFWKVNELENSWPLSEEETQLLKGQIAASRLGFSVQFKHFQLEGWFPTTRWKVFLVVFCHIAVTVQRFTN